MKAIENHQINTTSHGCFHVRGYFSRIGEINVGWMDIQSCEKKAIIIFYNEILTRIEESSWMGNKKFLLKFLSRQNASKFAIFL